MELIVGFLVLCAFAVGIGAIAGIAYGLYRVAADCRRTFIEERRRLNARRG